MRAFIHKQNGNILVMSVISTFSIMAFASMAIDLGCILTAKNQYLLIEGQYQMTFFLNVYLSSF